jgi:REP element-mobilizing transposase RayT
MPRANRHFLPDCLWHTTHRCHQRKFLLKFARDRRRYLHWLFEAKKRFGLWVLDYMVTSNHVHLLVRDTGPDVIAKSMQLIAGRTAQDYNQRKNRQGAFGEDRYHATAIEADEHLHRCLVYIDLNMVRAGRVNHPRLKKQCQTCLSLLMWGSPLAASTKEEMESRRCEQMCDKCVVARSAGKPFALFNSIAAHTVVNTRTKTKGFSG